MNWWVVYLVAALLITAGVFGAYALGARHGKDEGHRTGKDEGYSEGYEKGKRQGKIEASIGPVTPLVVEQRNIRHLRATLLVSPEEVHDIPAADLAAAIGRELSKRILDELPNYWEITSEYDPIAHAYQYQVLLDVVERGGKQDV